MMQRIVMCGSMKNKENMCKYADYLRDKGYEVVTPKEFKVEMSKIDSSQLHFNEIANQNTDIILAANDTKNGIEVQIHLQKQQWHYTIIKRYIF